MQISRRKLFGLIGAAAVSPLVKPLIALDAVVGPQWKDHPPLPLWLKPKLEQSFETEWVQTNTHMVFKPKFYYASVRISNSDMAE
jgi:hypothetical protein